MNSEALATLAELRRAGVRRRLKRARPTPPPQTRAIEREYARAILPIVARVKQSLTPLLDALSYLVRTDARSDASKKSVDELMQRARKSTASAVGQKQLEKLARKFAERTKTTQRVRMGGELRRTLGADVFVNDHGLREILDKFVTDNVALIKDVSAKIYRNVEDIVKQGIQGGTLHGDIAKQIQHQVGLGEKRAKLIARDQVGKVYGEINAQRQRNIGADRFIWRTVGDDRVRDLHRTFNGQSYSYLSPPDGLPGTAILCRCFAEADLSAILDALE